MKIKKKINIYLTKTELSQYNYFFLKYLFSKFEKQKLFNLVIISTNYTGKKYYRENTNFFKNIKWIDKNKLYLLILNFFLIIELIFLDLI